MNDKEFKIKKSTLEGIACMVLCFLIGYGYLEIVSPDEMERPFLFFGLIVLSFFAPAFGYQLASERYKIKSGFLYGILIFLVCLAGFHFLLYLPNS